jgi:hypothetical protein
MSDHFRIASINPLLIAVALPITPFTACRVFASANVFWNSASLTGAPSSQICPRFHPTRPERSGYTTRDDDEHSAHGYIPLRTFSKNATTFGENAPSSSRSAALRRSAARKSSAADGSSASGVRESIARVARVQPRSA